MDIAFVFPGQGSQYVGMAKEIFENYSSAREVFANASDALGYDVSLLCFNGPAEEMNRTFRTQPCLLTASTAIFRVLEDLDIRPAIVAGHSLGEYSALVAADVLSFTDALRLSEKRGLFMQEAVPEGEGLMAAILGLGSREVGDICSSVRSGYVAPANYNCPGQIVIAGEKEAVKEAIEISRKAGAKRAVPLAVSVPSHCRLMDPASHRLSNLLEEISFANPAVPVVNNADAMILTDGEELKKSLVRQLSRPLLWEDSVRAITGTGIKLFVEAGPGKVLSGLIKRIDAFSVVLNVEDISSLKHALQSIKAQIQR